MNQPRQLKRIDTALAGVCVIEPVVHGDARGYFLESFHADKYKALGIDARFVQSNVSHSARGVLRGLHYQWPNPQGKLVSVLEGEVYDVAVDIRRGSPTFGQWEAAMLTADNHRQLWIPEGFAHGFCVVSEAATFMYQCTALYDPAADAGVRWSDAAIGIDWPIAEPLLSAKDQQAPFLADVSPERLPVFAA
jgi:dTDP-4-dehydrorhamnose 3,5-epimerase